MNKVASIVSILVALFATESVVSAVVVGDTDFLVCGLNGDNVAVFDANFVFKGNLITNIDVASGVDVSPSGTIVAVAIGNGGPRAFLFNRNGEQIGGFANPDIGGTINIKIGPDGRFYAATQNYNSPAGLIEFSPSGSTLRLLGNGDFEGVAVLPGNRLWAGGGSNPDNFMYEYNIVTGTRFPLPLDHGQEGGGPMRYSPSTNTVLICDDDKNTVFERTLEGVFVRSFAVTGMRSLGGVTRGPNGEVYISDQLDHRIYRFGGDGTFLNFIDVHTTANFPVDLTWVGNVPEPAASFAGAAGILLVRRRPRRDGQEQKQGTETGTHLVS